MNCRRCKQPLENWFGTKPEPYCSVCWMIYYYAVSETQAQAVEAEIDVHRQRGVDEGTLKTLLHNAVRALARDKIKGITVVSSGRSW